MAPKKFEMESLAARARAKPRDPQTGDEGRQIKAHGVGDKDGTDEDDKAKHALQGRDKRLFCPVQLVVGVKHHDDVLDDVDQPERPNDHGDGHDELQDAWKETHGQIGHQHRGIHAFHVIDHDSDEEIGEANTHGGPQRLVGILNGLALDGLGARMVPRTAGAKRMASKRTMNTMTTRPTSASRV